MRLVPLLAAGLAVGVLTAGCYESSFPIDTQPQADGERRLLGVWRCVANDADVTERAVTITIAPGVGRVYAITFQEDGKDADHYEAYASLVGGERVFNTGDLSGGSKPWVFIRYFFLRPSVLQLELLNGDVLGEQQSPAALRATVERLQKSGTAFEDLCTCARAREHRE